MPPKISEEQNEQIIELCLDRVPVRVIAERLGVNKNTVTARWRAYLDARSKSLRDEVEREHQRVLASLDRIAGAAWQAHKAALAEAEVSENGGAAYMAAAKGFMAEAIKAEKEYARLAGMDIQRVEHTGKNGGPIEVRDPKAMLAARLAAMTPAVSNCAPDDSDA